MHPVSAVSPLGNVWNTRELESIAIVYTFLSETNRQEIISFVDLWHLFKCFVCYIDHGLVTILSAIIIEY